MKNILTMQKIEKMEIEHFSNMYKKDCMKKDVIRVGDYVQLIKPERVVRVGYPMCLEDTIVEVEKDSKTIEILKQLGLRNQHAIIRLANGSFSLAERKVIEGIAQARMIKNNFGGNERKLYIKPLENSSISFFDFEEQFQKRVFEVIRKKVVKTGRYSSASYDEEKGYCPSTLQNQETHVLYQLSGIYDCWIQKENLKKLSPKSANELWSVYINRIEDEIV